MKKRLENSNLFIFICATYFVLVFSADNGDPCVTPNKENGKCIPVNSCDVIRRAIAYFNPEAMEFAKKSQCGYDNNEGPLVCCGSAGRLTTPAPKTTTMKPITSADVGPAKPINHLLLPDETSCGFHPEGSRKPGIIAGMTEFPWMASLHYDNGGKGYFGCSGVLINHRYVLTAAACLSVPDTKLDFVRLGEWQFSEKTEVDDAVIDVPVAKMTSHPYYSKRSGNDNIALLRLDTKVKYSDSIRPICLPPMDFPQPPPGDVLETSGWGLTKDGCKSDVKIKAEIVISDYDECQKAFPRYRQRYPNQICAKPTKYDFCNGETGIPVVKSYTKNTTGDLDEQWFLEGLLTKEFGCTKKRK
ncbi:hypothetical protein ILUMI_09744 [Ignelater luminosus]|uniref:CLIP domain-containing serine protease n=1 Tax=Ignelater luminosus TaxID=2038154 RepID=A0A8K0GFN6_IGNLU|nr:hypothetical protein ILUMI_09744 [Ignelater luminosus]